MDFDRFLTQVGNVHVTSESMELTNECFNCGRKIVDASRFTIVMPLSNETYPGGYVCERCLHSVGQEISVYPLTTSTSKRAFAII